MQTLGKQSKAAVNIRDVGILRLQSEVTQLQMRMCYDQRVDTCVAWWVIFVSLAYGLVERNCW